ncbi:non-ribosomal peptide synthetase [Salinispora pacifica]|uniref:non-ribosomal peptide synthetase n=1 Tax=Salinispora pacifica TaxID=351187 RepID=UPI000379503F|nr:non-ribosomal peptide synthetase [Salinispora pacifica]
MSSSTTGWDDVRPFAEEFAVRAARWPEATAVTGPDGTYSYAALASLVSARAGWLQQQGVGPETVVGIAAHRAGDTVAWVLAVLHAGVAFLPLDPANPTERLRYLVESGRPDIVIAAPELDARVLDAGSIRVFRTDARTDGSPAMAPVRPHPLALAYVVHTSGSTNQPKPVGISHEALARCALGWLEAYDLVDRPMTHLQLAGFGFDVFVSDLGRCLFSGGTLIIAPPKAGLAPARLAGLIEHHRVAMAEFTPSLLFLLVEYLAATGQALAGLRTVAVGGEPWRAVDFSRVSAAFPNASVINTYGLVETTIDNLIHHGPPAVEHFGGPMPLGVAHSGTEAFVADPATGAVRRTGVGELYLAGQGIGRGYLRSPAQTAERFVPHPHRYGQRALRTGDLVRRDEDGSLHYLGRIDDQQKVRGTRINLDEVAAVLAAHPEVALACATVITTEVGTVLYGHLVVKDETLADDEVWAYARERLPPEAVPARLLRHQALPLNPNGKVDRPALAELAAADSDASAAPTAGIVDDDPVARTVVTQWRAVLGRAPATLGDNFFASGGDSVALARLAVRLGAIAGAPLDIAAVHRDPTPAGLAHALAQGKRSGWSVPRRPDADRHPLSDGQRTLWLHSVLYPDDPTYTVPTEILLEGHLDVTALGAAITAVVTRHEPLRSVIRLEGGEPTLAVLAPAPVALPVRVVAGPDDGDQIVDDCLRRPFRLDREPPVRCLLLTEREGRHRLVLAVHHIATDGASIRVMLEELGAAYDRAIHGEPVVREAPDTTYGDLVHWRRISPSEAANNADYWRSHLGSTAAPPLLWPASQSPTGHDRTLRHQVRLDAGQTRALRRVARDAGTTVFATMLAAMAELVARWSGDPAPRIGFPVSRRDHPAALGLIGFFIDTLVTRIDTTGMPGLTELATRAHREIGTATTRRTGPFAHSARPAEGAGPPFRVWFNHFGPPDEPPRMDGLRTALRVPPAPGALFEVNVYVTEHVDGITVELVHGGRHDAAGAVELLDQYHTLLTAASSAPARPVRQHRFPTGRLPDPADPLTARKHVRPARRIATMLRRHAGRTALRDPAVDCDWHTVDRRVRDAAGALRHAGVAPGRTVAVHGRRTADFVVSVLAVLRAGGRLVVLDPRHPTRRQREQLVRSAVRCLVVPAGPAADTVPATLNWTGPVVDVGPDGRVAATLKGQTGHTGHDEVLNAADYVAFTSGTTGTPIAVSGRLDPVWTFLGWYADRFALGPDDRFALLSGLGHDPVFRDLLAPLWTGGALHVPDERTHLAPNLLADWLGREAITVVHLTPLLARLILDALPPGGLPALRLVCLAGDEVPPALVAELRRAAPHATVVNGYGTTETPQLASYAVLDPPQPVSIGRGLPGTQLLVVDDQGVPCGVGEPGDIVVRSRHLLSGYLGDTAERARFGADDVPGVQRFHTGDRGRYRTDGSVEWLGRSGDLVKIRGHRVSPAEIDRVVRGDERISAVVTVTRDGPLTTELVTFVVPRPGSVLLPTQIRELVGQELPRAAVPAHVIVVGSLPLGPNGKVDRAALVRSIPERPDAGVTEASPAQPLSPAERQLANVCAAVLGINRIGPTDNFFDLGANSLQVIALHAAIRRQIDPGVALLALYEYPNVRALARRLAAAGGHDDPERPAIARGRSRSRHDPGAERDRRLAAREALTVLPRLPRRAGR